MKTHIKQATAFIITLIMLLNIFPISIFSLATNAMSLTVSTVSGAAGETVEVDVTVANNPGIASLKFDIAYSEDLILEGIEFNPAFGAYATSPTPYKNPQPLTMISPLADITVNGVFATLTFKIADDAAAGDHEIAVTFRAKDIYNANFDDVAMTATNGSVTVGGTIPAPDPTPDPTPDPEPTDAMLLTVGSATGAAGETVEVDVTVANNPGIASLKFDIAYSEGLILEGIEFNPAFGAYATSPTPYKNPQPLTMISPLADITVNGVFATLTFKIADDATAGDHEISVSFRAKDIYNANFDDVAMTVANGSVTVAEAEAALLGDVNLDGEIDAKDLTLLARHVAKIEYITDPQALVNADINKDSGISSEDLTKLARHVAKIEYIVQ